MNDAALVLRFVLAFATIAAVLVALAYVLRLLGGRLPVARGRKRLALVESLALGQGAALYLVRIGSREVVIAGGGVALISALEPLLSGEPVGEAELPAA